MERVYRLPTMRCSGCAAAVEQAVRTVPGVRSVHADPTTKEVRVLFEENTLNEDLLRQALERAGYPVVA